MTGHTGTHNIFRLLLSIIFLISVLPIADTAEGQPGISSPVFQRGMCYVTWNKWAFDTKYSARSMSNLKNMGVDYVQIVVTQYQNNFDSTKIKSTGSTPSDESIEKAISLAHDLGMKVMLKPHIDLLNKGDDNYWRADIGFYKETEWKKWFSAYQKIILHYAEIAAKNKVEIFCVGTELSFATQKTQYWLDIISKVRGVYSGELIYAANWDNYRNVKFWDQLDYAGIDAYFPLTYKTDPTVEDIKNGWIQWKYQIEEWQAGVNKPVIFTELGYPSSVHAPSEPWAYGSGKADLEMQRKCYEAFFEAKKDWDWLAGVYWWEWGPDTQDGGKRDNHFTPMQKPAAQVIEANYKAIIERELGIAADQQSAIVKENLETMKSGPIKIDALLIEKLTAGTAMPGPGMNIVATQNISPPVHGNKLKKEAEKL